MRAAIAIIPISVTNGGTAAGLLIDTKPGGVSYDFCHIQVMASTANVVSNTLSVLKLEQADTTDSTNLADLSVGGTDFTIATNAYTTTTNQNIWSWNVDLRGRKRYLKVSASPQTTMVIGAGAALHRGSQAPNTAAKANALNVVNI
jgi:hypothetical protein